MRSLTLKLTLAFLVVSLTGIALVAALVWSITSREFNRFVIDRGLNEYTTAVTAYYKTNHGWDGIETKLRQEGLLASQGPLNENTPPQPPFVLIDQNHQVVVAAGHLHPGEALLPENNQKDIPITVNNQVVGYVITTGGPGRPNPLETRFMQRTNQALMLAALGAMLIAILLGVVLARTITRPVRELTLAARALAAGDFSRRVRVRSKDEVGELTTAFNTMSADIQLANEVRRQMTADIAHDLRTPLSVIVGYLEGLKDGIVKPSPKRFAAMYDEAIYLQRLVEDLRTLSLADANELSLNLQPVQPAELVEKIADSFQHQARQSNIDLKIEVDDSLPTIQVDPERMQQALSNLVMNALRFTPAGGTVTLSAHRCGANLCMDVRDTGQGIAPENLSHVFERFYRGDNARHSEGSGLGLAIAKSIVEIQKGHISAESAGIGQGSLFRIQIPAQAG